MKLFRCFAFIALSFFYTSQVKSQLLDSLIRANRSYFTYDQTFSGMGWTQLMERVNQSHYVLIGEDHFIREIPLFTQALIRASSFQNYVAELDPWMMQLFQDKITRLSNAELQRWIDSNYNCFSFFQKQPDFDLLKTLVQKKIRLLGLEQICLTSTSVIFQYLYETGSPQNRKQYAALRDSSSAVNEVFFKDLAKPYFFKSPSFAKQMAGLDRSSMQKDEKEVVDALMISQKIYQTGSHSQRIKLMQQNFLQYYTPYMKGKRSLFRFGANHAMKGESYLPVYDIGTTAHVLAQSEQVESYHILVLPKSGLKAGFLNGTEPVDLSDDLFKSLSPFFTAASDTAWTFITLDKIRRVLNNKSYHIPDANLEKTIKGYDAIIIIPVATPAPALR